VHADAAEIIVPRSFRSSDPGVVVHRTLHMPAAMVRTRNGIRVTGIEATLVALATVLEDERLEIACEDARRRRLTTTAAMRAYLVRHAKPGVAGVQPLRALLDELDPKWPSRSTLEVKTRRLLVARGLRGFEREFPLEWNGRTYRFDFAFRPARVILETNGRRWHDDASDYERDNQKWSVPSFHDYHLVLATWDKVTRHPDDLLTELAAAGVREGQVRVGCQPRTSRATEVSNGPGPQRVARTWPVIGARSDRRTADTTSSTCTNAPSSALDASMVPS
jgi:hypothetical protein